LGGQTQGKQIRNLKNEWDDLGEMNTHSIIRTATHSRYQTHEQQYSTQRIGWEIKLNCVFCRTDPASAMIARSLRTSTTISVRNEVELNTMSGGNG
jgi:hypothetical protein